MDFMNDFSSERFLSNKFGDHYLYSINRSVFNEFGAEAVYARQFPDLLQKEETLYVVVGTDSGLLLDYIKSQIIPDGTKVLCIELPEVIERLKGEDCFQGLGEKIECVAWSDFARFEKESNFRIADYFTLDRVESIISFAAADAFVPEYRELVWNVDQMLNQRQWAAKISFGRKHFIKTQLMNVAENRYPAANFRGEFAGKTAVLLGGGPTLDDFLPWLQKNRQNVVVLAVSRISRRLREVGLSPDFVFSVDPQKLSFVISRDMLLFDRAILINAEHVSPQLLAQWSGDSYYCGNLFPWESPLNAPNQIPAFGPTVTNFAFANAVEMGFSQIVLAGVDLCFDQAGNTHAKGTAERSVGPQFSYQQCRVKTNRGSDAATLLSMKQAVTFFGKQAELALERGCRTINTALDAAEIDNVEYCPVEDVDLGAPDADVQTILAAIRPENSRAERIAHYEAVIAELLRAQAKLRQIKKLAKDGLKFNDGLFGRNGMKADFKYKIKMDSLEKKLNRSFADFMPLVKVFNFRNIIKIKRLKESNQWTDQEIEEAGRLYYESCRDSSDSLIELIDDALARTRSRLEEEGDDADFEAIFRQWSKDEVPGRASVLKTRNLFLEGRVRKETEKRLADFEKQFTATMEQEEANRAQQFAEKADPDHARKNALLLFRSSNQGALEQLVAGLTLFDTAEAGRVAHLVKGYLAELKGAPERALDEYQGAIGEAVDPVTEDALRRVSSLSLSLSDFENAALALQCLASISPIYLLQYAELSRLSGDMRHTVDLYADYLGQVPDDTRVMLKLAGIYKDQGLLDGAEMLYREILELEPDSSAAKTLLAELKK